MGIFINLNISDSITENEWTRAYQKSIKMVEKLPLIENISTERYGARLYYATKTVEREHYRGEIGWRTTGDSISMKTAEDYFLPKNIIRSDKTNECPKSYVDPYMSILPAYSNFSFEDERCDRVIGLWGNKTQAEPYHFYLLAIACMLEHELPGKVAIYGDITRGQCKSAVKIASDILNEQIRMPDRCDIQRLYTRVREMPLQKEEIIDAFTVLYLGNQDKEFGVFVYEHFSEEEWAAFWKQHFGHSKIGTYGFSEWLKKYLLWGFPVNDLKNHVPFRDADGNDLSEEFVKSVLDTEVFLKEKNCEDALEIDHEEEGSYSIYTLLAQFVFAGAKNHRVNRYIPMEELKMALAECVGDCCDISKIIAEHLTEHTQKESTNAPADLLNGYLHDMGEAITSSKEEYDISDAEELLYFKKGNTIAPSLAQTLSECFTFYRSVLNEDRYKNLLEKGAQEAIPFLIAQNRFFLLMEESWNRIFNEIENDINALERYYPMVRIRTSEDAHQIVLTLVLNDEFYSYCMEHYAQDCSNVNGTTDQTAQ